MEELKEIWKSIESDPIENRSIHAHEVRTALSNKSLGLMDMLSQRVLQKLWITIVLTLAFAVVVPFVSPSISQWLISLLILVFGAGSVVLAIEYRVLRKGFDMSQHMLNGLKDYHRRIARVLRYEEVLSLIMYPIAISAGFVFGMRLAIPNAEMFDKPVQWMILGVSIVLLSFIGHRATKWLNKRAFGDYMNSLVNNIKELEDAEGGAEVMEEG